MTVTLGHARLHADIHEDRSPPETRSNTKEAIAIKGRPGARLKAKRASDGVLAFRKCFSIKASRLSAAASPMEDITWRNNMTE